MENQNTQAGGMTPQTLAIVAYITLIGWIVALVINNNNKQPLVSFHLRQMLGLIIMSFVGIIPFVGWILSIAAFVLWILGFISAINGEEKPVPIVGDYFQQWFKGL